MRLIHTSDLHLGDENLPCNRTDASVDTCVCPLLAVKQATETWRPDVVIVAGDFFDNARVSDELLRLTANLLASMAVPVVISPGNHDALTAGGVYDRLLHLDGHVHVARDPHGDTMSVLDGELTIWAKPTVHHTPKNRPLAEVPVRPPHGHFVVAAHGEYMDATADGSLIQSASPISAEEIRRTRADYVALGHWSRRACVAKAPVPAWYSGSPLHGQTGGVLAVTLGPETVVEYLQIDVSRLH